MSSLYQISDEIRYLRDLLEVESEFESDSDEKKQIEESLAIKQEELVEKVEGYLHVISQVNAQADMAEKEIQRIMVFKKRKEHIAERLNYALLQALLEFGEDDKGVKRLEIGTHRLSTRRSVSTQINDEERVPDECKLCDATFKNISIDIKNFLVRRIQELPDSSGKSKLIESFSPGIKISKELVKKYLNEHPPVEDEETLENDSEAIEKPFAEQVTKYSLTIK